MQDSFYEITTSYKNDAPMRTILMISMEQADWDEFEKTALFYELIEYLDRLENRTGGSDA